MGGIRSHTFIDAPSFWRVAEDERRGIHVFCLHPKAKKSELEDRIQPYISDCEIHWPRPDPGSESEHRGDCWLVLARSRDVTPMLRVLQNQMFGKWHIKAKRAKKEKPQAGTPNSPLPSPNSPLPAQAALSTPPSEPATTAPSHPIAFVNTTTGDVTIVTQVSQGPKGFRQAGGTGTQASLAIPSDLSD